MSESIGSRLWVWGYILKENRPARMEFVDHAAGCSLETAAAFLGAENIVFMDSTSDRGRLNDEVFAPVVSCRRVICGLQHGFEADTARRVSEFSLRHSNITGAVIDDFLDEVGPSRDMTVEQLRTIYEALKSANPALKLYVVRYSRQDFSEIIPYLPYLDGISFWCWISSDHYWRCQYHQDLVVMRRKYPGKEILQGIFVHDYGDTNGPQPMDRLELQTPRIGRDLRDGWTDGIVVLQNGWFDAEDHRRQVMYLRDYFTWLRGTQTLFHG